ncbi:unnamed protein product [Durusdinium trenchii]|uniref:Folate receptor-like domain-containing protein n=1 Tax=Durusdinium trenchii TaxID=1381693 RepID=A0ABP0PAD7_9DINO
MAWCKPALGLSVLLPPAWAYYQTTAQNCRRIDHIYASGQELCEKMWGTAFRYEPNETHGYTMWFFDSENPNDLTSAELGRSKAEFCHLHQHKDEPGPEPTMVSECHPWRFNSCCRREMVSSLDALKASFGNLFHWDRCGPLSQECERFFVQEACFYECDPNVAFYRSLGWEVAVTGLNRCELV